MARHYKHKTPCRVAYEKKSPDEREAFINFLKKTRHVLNHTNRAGGDISYILAVLTLMRNEELCYPYRQSGRYVPYPWEFKNIRPELLSESSRHAEKIIDGKYVEIDLNDLPEFLIKKLKEMNEHSLFLRTNPLAVDGKLTTTYSLDICHEKEKYVLTFSNSMPLKNIEIKYEKKGKRGEPQSSAAMYMLYRYFKRIKLKGIHQAIATLCNEFSSLFFRPSIGAPLSPDNVRKRVQWTKDQKHLVEYAERFEEKWGKEMLEKDDVCLKGK